jgi:beta-lactamase regulating signal transducer with metallopeptidase domain
MMSAFTSGDFVTLLWHASWQATILFVLVYLIAVLTRTWIAAKYRVLLWAIPIFRLLILVVPISSLSLFTVSPSYNSAGTAVIATESLKDGDSDVVMMLVPTKPSSKSSRDSITDSTVAANTPHCHETHRIDTGGDRNCLTYATYSWLAGFVVAG